ncbi:hypothetical protein [Sandaracinobacteroides saxicola]|uniref:Uncharacterized protein n=1 Tax=Sandaracinobacteroides saxicola TaxID=2759707 RepID=A0A7G5IKX4_9SPHN|nr:hypothetical protein [Sandaracinobacteroides saxicola]QMW24016.1 hypothetical protein H3309_06005 [Sandaracinobacteroides saxicola]
MALPPPLSVLRSPAAALAAALAAIGLAAWLRRRRPPLLLRPAGTVAIVTADGKLWRFIVAAVPTLPDRRLAGGAVIAQTGLDGNAHVGRGLGFSPDRSLIRHDSVEYFAGGFDERVTLYRVSDGAALFSRTDVSFPTTSLLSTDPGAPAWLLAEQAWWDENWAFEQQSNPAAERTIAAATFFDDNESSLSTAGWTAAGQLVITGLARMQTQLGVSSAQEPWFGIVGADPAGNWTWLQQGHGPCPVPLLPSPPAIAVADLGGPQGAGSSFRLDGVVQSNTLLANGVLDCSPALAG